MKYTRILAIAISAITLGSCATSNDVVDGGLFQKRKYNNGFHFSKKTQIDTEKSNVTNQEVELAINNGNNTEEIFNATEKINSQFSLTNEYVFSEVKSNSNELSSQDDIINEYDAQNKEQFQSIEDFSKTMNLDKTSEIPALVQRKNIKGSFRRTLNTASQNETTDNTLLLVIIAIFIPFLAVGLYDGLSTRFWISLLLTLLFVLPGIIYAILIVTGMI